MVSTQTSSYHCPEADSDVKYPYDTQDPDVDHESLSHLQIPTLSVSGTPASWISHSKLVTNKMSSQYDGDSSCDEAVSSLGDSAYDFLDDRSATTDDEERDFMADSTSSEGLEPHLLSSPSAAPNHIRQDSHLDDSPVSLQTPTTRGFGLGNTHTSLNIREGECLAEDSEEPIHFEEPSVVKLNSSRLTEVCHTLRTIHIPLQTEGQIQKAIKTLPEGLCQITVRQTMASQSIDLKGKPYKVLVIGHNPATELVIKKIASALATSTKNPTEEYDEVSPAKFSIVPVSAFGDSGNPDVVLIDSGLELSVEHCLYAYYTPDQVGKDVLHMRMTNREIVQSGWIQSEGQYSLSKNWTLPDLAIFFTPEEDKKPDADMSDMTRGVAQSFMHRHGIPSIFIEKQATWVKSSTLDYLTPHLCLETQQVHGQRDSAKARYPIDLPTFLNIDAGQLNRNLACLAQSRLYAKSRTDTSKKSKASQGITWFPYTWKSCSQTIEGFQREYTPHFLELLKFNSLYFITLVLLGSFMVGVMISAATTMDTSMSSIANSSIAQETTQVSLSSAFTPVVSSIASTSLPKSPSKSLSSNTEIASFLLDAYALGPDRSDDFLVQILGDHHIVVNTPRWMHQSKKAPALLFEISRQNKSIEYTSSKIGEGVHALQIPHEEAYGLLNVSMTIKSKVPKQKNFEVDFGSSWLQKVEWKRLSRSISDAVQQDLSVMQSGLSTVFNHSLSGLSNLVHRTRHTIATQRRVKRAMMESHLKWRSQTRSMLIAQSKELSRYMSRIRAGRKELAQQKRAFARSISSYTNKHAQALSRHANMYRQKFRETNAERHAVAAEYLKNVQKKALRAWWRIVGVPKRSPLHRSPAGKNEATPDKPKEDEKVHSCF